MSVYVATLGRNPVVVLQGLLSAVAYIQKTSEIGSPISSIYLLPETQEVSQSPATHRLLEVLGSIVGQGNVAMLEAPHEFTDVASLFRQANIAQDQSVFLNYSGGRKYVSLAALQFALDQRWYGFSLNPYDRAGYSVAWQCTPSGIEFERQAVAPTPLKYLLDLNQIEVLPNPTTVQSAWSQSHGCKDVTWVKVESHEYAVVQNLERLFVCDPNALLIGRDVAAVKPQTVRRQSHARQIGDLLAVPVYRLDPNADAIHRENVRIEVEQSGGVIFNETFEQTIADYRSRVVGSSSLVFERSVCVDVPVSASGKILIALVGDQPMVVYGSFLAHQPHDIYLLTTPEKRSVADNIQLALSSEDCAVHVCAWLNSATPNTTAEVIAEILEVADPRRVVLNVSGSTTPMSASAFLISASHDLYCVEYLDWNRLICLAGKTTPLRWKSDKQNCTEQLTTIFSLHGFDFKPLTPYGQPRPNLEMYRLARANPVANPDGFNGFKTWWKDSKFGKFETGSRNDYRLYCDLMASFMETDAIVFAESQIIDRATKRPMTPDAVVFLDGKTVLFDAKRNLVEALNEDEAEGHEKAMKSELVAGHFASGMIVLNSCIDQNMNIDSETLDVVEQALVNITQHSRAKVVVAARNNYPFHQQVMSFPGALTMIFSGCKAPNILENFSNNQMNALEQWVLEGFSPL